MWRCRILFLGKIFEDDLAQGAIRTSGEYLQVQRESLDVQIVLRGIQL
jgi:hypothetical protein